MAQDFYSQLGQVIAQQYSQGQQRAQRRQQLVQQQQQQQQMGELRKATANLYKAKAKNLETEGALGNILHIIARTKPPEQVLTPPQIQQAAPLGRPLVGGGAVGTMPGAIAREGQIYSPTGERIGEYPEGRPPARLPGAIPEILSKQFGITQPEAAREVFGLPKVAKEKEPTRQAEFIEFLKDFAGGDYEDLEEARDFLLDEYPEKETQINKTYYRLIGKGK